MKNDDTSPPALLASAKLASAKLASAKPGPGPGSPERRGTYELRDPADLVGHFHPALKTIPELAEESLEFLAIAGGIEKCGIIQPLLVDEQGRILDDHSRTLLRCARRWQMKSVPVQVRDSGDVHALIIHSLAHRRHFTKSALAYLACPHLGPAFAAASEKRLKNLANCQCFSKVAEGTIGAKTVEALATDLGIERRLLFEARKVHEEFEDEKKYRFLQFANPASDVVEMTLREYFEPRILRAPFGGEHEQHRPMGLGGVIAGIATVREEKRGIYSPKTASQLELFSDGFDSFTGRALRVTPEAMRKGIRTWFDEHEEKLSDEQLNQIELLGETIKTQARQMRKSKNQTNQTT